MRRPENPTRRANVRTLPVTLLSIVLVIAAAACGGGGSSGSATTTPSSVGTTSTRTATGTTQSEEVARGRMLFQTAAGRNLACAFCHTLRAAATQGIFASDLDEEGDEYRGFGWSADKIRSFVLGQIHKPQCPTPN